MLADRHQALTSSRTQAVCRLHVLLREMVPGGAPVRLSAERAGVILRGVRADDLVAIERKRLARAQIGDIRRLDRDIAAVRARITDAVVASGTTLSELHGVGPITAALTRMGSHDETQRYVERRLDEGKTKREIMRILKRYIAREVYKALPPA